MSAESPYYQHQLQVWLTFCVTAQLAESSGFCSHAPSPRQGPRLTLKNFHQQVGCVRMPHHPTQAGIHWELRCLTKVMEFLHDIIFHSSLSWFSLSLLVTLDSRISFPIIVTQANPVLALIMPGQVRLYTAACVIFLRSCLYNLIIMMLDVLGFFCVKLLAAWFPVLSDVVIGATVHTRANIEIRY